MIWNPWRRARDLARQVAELEQDVANMARDRDDWARIADQWVEKYNKIRETNLQLRDAIELYRNA